MRTPSEFELTSDHVALLRRVYVTDYGGVPAIDGKRPYGNSNVMLDVAEILGWELFYDDDEERRVLSAAQRTSAERLHRSLTTALQVVLSTGSFKLGRYRQADAYQARSWTLIEAYDPERIERFVGTIAWEGVPTNDRRVFLPNALALTGRTVEIYDENWNEVGIVETITRGDDGVVCARGTLRRRCLDHVPEIAFASDECYIDDGMLVIVQARLEYVRAVTHDRARPCWEDLTFHREMG